MKWVILLVLGMLLLSGCGLSQEQCKSVAMQQINSWCALQFDQGIDKGIELCEDDYKPMLDQFNPPEGCVIVVLDEFTMKYVCNDTGECPDPLSITEIRSDGSITCEYRGVTI